MHDLNTFLLKNPASARTIPKQHGNSAVTVQFQEEAHSMLALCLD